MAGLAGAAVCCLATFTGSAHSSAAPARATGTRIVVGRGIAGVQLGDPQARVSIILGKPVSVTVPNWNYGGQLHGAVEFDYWHRVEAISTTSIAARTSRGIGPGVSIRRFRSVYPDARCLAARQGTWKEICILRSPLHRSSVETDFLFSARLGMVEIFAVDALPSPQSGMS
jgi:hypothetical protein